jgi:hypothetical protein
VSPRTLALLMSNVFFTNEGDKDRERTRVSAISFVSTRNTTAAE